MQKFLSGLARPLAHVIHIGAGTGSDLPAYLKAGAGAVTLIEADPELARQLEAQIGDQTGVTVIEAAVSGDLRRRVFRRANAPELSSFRNPTGLKELFPGLRILSAEPVRPGDPVQLIKSLDLPGLGPESGPESGSTLLVIEAPGEALGILRALEAADLLMCFDAIRLQEGVARLYHKAATADEICAYLTGMGFSAALEKHPVDPERPFVNARIDRQALEHKRHAEALAKSLEQMRAQNKQLSARHDAASKEAEGLRAELAAAQQQSFERAEQIRDQMAAREKVGKELEGLRAELSAAQQKSREQDDRIGALSAAREAMHKEAEAARQAQTSTEHRLAQAREEMQRADGQIGLIRDLLLHGPGL